VVAVGIVHVGLGQAAVRVLGESVRAERQRLHLPRAAAAIGRRHPDRDAPLAQRDDELGLDAAIVRVDARRLAQVFLLVGLPRFAGPVVELRQRRAEPRPALTRLVTGVQHAAGAGQKQHHRDA
jgi:hypothetical protein